ncbi:hypothetical protein AB0J73_40350 [Nonomuraea fuscirosea]
MNGESGRWALLRARGDSAGSWEKFRFVRRQVGADVYYAVQSVANGLYVSAENNFTGANAGMLRARTPANQIGSWELFTMGFPEPYPGQGEPEAPSPTPRRQAQVMSWNVCADNNSACGGYRDDGDAVATALAQHLNATLGSAYHPDVLLLQEICERHTRTIESSLESRTGRGWDVRFAPIKVESEYPDLTWKSAAGTTGAETTGAFTGWRWRSRRRTRSTSPANCEPRGERFRNSASPCARTSRRTRPRTARPTSALPARTPQAKPGEAR